MAEITASPQPIRRIDLFSVGAGLIALIVLMPLLAVVGIALFPSENIWPHLLSTTLPRYVRNTLVLMIGVGTTAGVIGTSAAWLIARYRFFGAKWLEWLLLFPLAVPAYVGAYALVDFLEYAGPVQTGLRTVMGFESARDYWFPQIRSMGAAIVVISAALYPYVYLLARAAFREQSNSTEDVARSLGTPLWQRVWRIDLPMARPAIVAGLAVVMMETINDFGTVDYFAVQTLTTGIFSTWLESNNAGGAAQLSCAVLALVILLVALEKLSRKRSRFFAMARSRKPIPRKNLPPLPATMALLACALPVGVGFFLPVGVLLNHALRNAELWHDAALLSALRNTITVAGIAALVTVAAGLFLVYGVRLSKRRWPTLLLPVTTIGYAAPGAVLAVGTLLPLARLDHAMADSAEALFGINIGLILTGSAFALILAYSVRFFALAQGAADAALGRISPNLSHAAHSLGRTKGQVLREIHLPLMRGSVGAALLLVFVDCVKELPATLLLRPFNYETLATRVHDQASLENLEGAAPAAILVILVGMAAVALMAHMHRRS